MNVSVDELRDVVGKMALRNRAGSTTSSAGGDAWAASGDGVRQPLRAALTGDTAQWCPPRQLIAASLTGGTVRARPRAYTPTNSVFAQSAAYSQTLVASRVRTSSIV